MKNNLKLLALSITAILTLSTPAFAEEPLLEEEISEEGYASAGENTEDIIENNTDAHDELYGEDGSGSDETFDLEGSDTDPSQNFISEPIEESLFNEEDLEDESSFISEEPTNTNENLEESLNNEEAPEVGEDFSDDEIDEAGVFPWEEGFQTGPFTVALDWTEHTFEARNGRNYGVNTVKIYLNGDIVYGKINDHDGYNIKVYNEKGELACWREDGITYSNYLYEQSGEASVKGEKVDGIDGNILVYNAGTYTVKVTGLNEYEGCYGEATFTIKPYAADLICNIRGDNSDCTRNYTGQAQTYSLSQLYIVDKEERTKITPEFKQERDCYIAGYKNNVNIGTATIIVKGKGNYEGSYGEVDFYIKPENVYKITGYTVSVPSSTYTYTGKAIEPPVTVKYYGGGVVPSSDYTVSYEDNVDVGTAVVNVFGKTSKDMFKSGSTTFQIVKSDSGSSSESTSSTAPTTSVTAVYNSVKGGDIRWNTHPYAFGYVVYCERQAEGIRKVATINNPNTTSCYDTKIKNNCWGRVYHYYVTVLYKDSSGKTKEGPKSNKLALQRLSPMKITSASSQSAGKVTVKYSCVDTNKANGYEIQYAYSKSDLFGRKGTFKAVKLSGRNKLSKTLTGLTKDKTVYIRVRSYVDYTNSVTKEKTRTWSQYSNVKKVKVK